MPFIPEAHAHSLINLPDDIGSIDVEAEFSSQMARRMAEQIDDWIVKGELDIDNITIGVLPIKKVKRLKIRTIRCL